MYPLFTSLRWPIGYAPATRDVRLGKAWGVGGIGVACILAAVALASQLGWEWPWMGRDREADQTYIRHMTAHHKQGIELASLATNRAHDPHLQALASLMIASQAGESRIFDRWWQSWFGLPMPDCTAQERAEMPGYLTPEQMQEARSASSDQFDEVFVRMMTIHHKGAVRIAHQEWHSRGDPRLRIMAHAIRHEQQGEIALMERVEGIQAVIEATSNMFADNVN
jgi:uncharacterized protein (DUF305 family)